MAKEIQISAANHIESVQKGAVVAVIGGGPAAISLCAQFAAELQAQKCRQTVDFWVFERQGRIGGGLPFTPKADCFLLNLPTDVMEPIYGRRGDFTAWTRANAECPKDTKFPPRRFFGEYLEFVGLETKRNSIDFGLKIHYRTDTEVLGVRQESNGDYLVDTNTSAVPLRADYICLCTGHAAPRQFELLEGRQNFCQNPWAPGAFEQIKLDKSADVAVLGTRLTAIDVVLRLKSLGHTGKILMASRSGLVPTVLPPKVDSHHFRHLTLTEFFRLTNFGSKPLGLTDLADLLRKEICDAEGPNFSPAEFFVHSSRQISPLDWLNREIDAAESPKGRKWLEVLFSFYPLIPALWPLLTESDQKDFLQRHFSIFLTYLAAFPLENARRIRDYLASGQLDIRGGLVDTRPDGNFFKLKFADETEVTADWVFNATGCDRDVRPDPLSRQMIQAGLVTPHPLGGLKVDPASLRTFNGQNCRNGRLAAIGASTRGAALLTADMATVASQAGRVAAWMAAEICRADKSAGGDQRG